MTIEKPANTLVNEDSRRASLILPSLAANEHFSDLHIAKIPRGQKHKQARTAKKRKVSGEGPIIGIVASVS